MKTLPLPALLAALLLLPGCGNTDENPAPDASYTVRGEVLQLPDGTPLREFMIYHEAIPDWVDGQGRVGMEEMPMPFAVADGVSLNDLQPGDKIEFTVDTFFAAENPPAAYHISQITKLPADTELTFTKGPGSTTQPHHHHHH
ncbi:MAG: copper-binding protein [Planctomycetota bacterium]